jgi:TRAP-type C4-dicarboxylate transport system permease small subunit
VNLPNHRPRHKSILVQLAEWSSGGSAAVAGFILISMTAYTIIEIVRRTLFGSSSNVLTEFVGYGLAAMTMLAASKTMREGGLIRVNVLLQFASPRVRQVLDAFCLLCGMFVLVLAAYYVWIDMQRSFTRGYETDSLIPLPMWLPPLGLFIGMLAFLLNMAALLFLVITERLVLADKSPDEI